MLGSVTSPVPLPPGYSLPIEIHGVVHTSSVSDTVILVLQLGLLVATGALAIYTALLFRATSDVAKDTLDASRWADRHHQEQFSPIVIWDVDWCEYYVAREMGTSPRPTLGISGSLRNIGSGPALNVRAFVKMAQYETDENRPIELGFIAPGENRSTRVDIRDPGLAIFGDVEKSSGPFTIKIWAFSQFGTLIECKMILDELGKRPRAEFSPTTMKTRQLGG